jgi:ubiquinone/menaquinone biosynthesis C-methylase UbiE
MAEKRCEFYEGETLRAVTGDTIRPGGLDLTGRALSFCALAPDARILDLACGVGATVKELKDHYHYQAFGIDASELLLATGLTNRPGLSLARAFGRALPAAHGQFQAVFIECSLSIMAEPEQVLDEVHRVLVPGGVLILSDLYLRNPQAAGLLRTQSFACCLRGARSQVEVIDSLRSHGFEIALWEDHSESIRDLTRKIIFSMGSMQGFWEHTIPGDVDAFELQLAISRAKPGYFLLVARKAITM